MKQIKAHPNNFMVGRNGTKIDRVVLHWIVGTLESADATFKNSSRIASAHYGIGDEEVHQYVDESDTAFANGSWSMNLRAVSIEHEGGPNLPISDETYRTSGHLVADICRRHNIPIDREHILKHKEVSDNPTQCPGTLDIDRIINEAKKYIPAPSSQVERIKILTYAEAYKQAYQGLRGVTGSDDEVAHRVKEGKQLQEMIDDVCKNDQLFFDKWVKPHIKEVTTDDLAKLPLATLVKALLKSLGLG